MLQPAENNQDTHWFKNMSLGNLSEANKGRQVGGTQNFPGQVIA